MKTTFVALSIRLLAAALVAAAAAPVYAQGEEVIATVPFDFVVGAARLPAGKYIVRPASEDPSVIMIESADGHRGAVTLTLPAADRHASDHDAPRLTFETRGSEHVLASVVEIDGTVREVLTHHPAAAPAASGVLPESVK
jgi:hypothetical protein